MYKRLRVNVRVERCLRVTIKFIVSISFTHAIVKIHLKTRERLKTCLQGGGGPQVGEVTRLSI